MQWLFDVKICIVEIHTSVIILWFFYLYFMKGIKLHWNICCYKRENVDVIWIRLDTTMQCRGINRKDCSQVTDFGNFGFQSLLRRLGVLEKNWKSARLRLANFQFVSGAYSSNFTFGIEVMMSLNIGNVSINNIITYFHNRQCSILFNIVQYIVQWTGKWPEEKKLFKTSHKFKTL